VERRECEGMLQMCIKRYTREEVVVVAVVGSQYDKIGFSLFCAELLLAGAREKGK
jgi:hypothetical protein